MKIAEINKNLKKEGLNLYVSKDKRYWLLHNSKDLIEQTFKTKKGLVEHLNKFMGEENWVYEKN